MLGDYWGRINGRRVVDARGEGECGVGLDAISDGYYRDEEEPFWEEAFGLGEVGLDCFHFGGGGGVAIERVPGVRGRGFLGRRRVGGGLAG